MRNYYLEIGRIVRFKTTFKPNDTFSGEIVSMKINVFNPLNTFYLVDVKGYGIFSVYLFQVIPDGYDFCFRDIEEYKISSNKQIKLSSLFSSIESMKKIDDSENFLNLAYFDIETISDNGPMLSRGKCYFMCNNNIAIGEIESIILNINQNPIEGKFQIVETYYYLKDEEEVFNKVYFSKEEFLDEINNLKELY